MPQLIAPIGITERGDPAFDKNWVAWVKGGRPAVLITKDPHAIYLELLSLETRNVIVHATITGFGGTKLEPNVAPFDVAMDGYVELCRLLGRERVVLRIDPIIPTPKGIKAAKNVLSAAAALESLPGGPERVRISFLDFYSHVKKRFECAGLPLLPYGLHAPLELRKSVWEELSRLNGSEIEVCGEPGIPSSPCIGTQDCKVLGATPVAKRRDQRKDCGCLANKVELLTGQDRPCKHGCLYCYWQSRAALETFSNIADREGMLT